MSDLLEVSPYQVEKCVLKLYLKSIRSASWRPIKANKKLHRITIWVRWHLIGVRVLTSCPRGGNSLQYSPWLWKIGIIIFAWNGDHGTLTYLLGCYDTKVLIRAHSSATRNGRSASSFLMALQDKGMVWNVIPTYSDIVSYYMDSFYIE